MIVNRYNKNFYKKFDTTFKQIMGKICPDVTEKVYIPVTNKIYDKYTNPIVKRQINEILNNDSMPLFQRIEIETLNRCNNSCHFCPVNRNDDPRPYCKMKNELFFSIISQLKALNYSGSITIFSNNEPLLDDRIFEFCKVAKEELPNAYHYLYTNGTLLTVDKFEKLIVNLDKLIIDNYNDKLKLIKPVKEVYEYCQQNKIYTDKVEIHLRKINEFLTSRGGQANNRSSILSLKTSCLYPFIQIVIRPDGKVSLCCNDALGKMTLGDLTKQSILEVWKGEQYKKIRCLIQKSRTLMPLCKNCDTILRCITKY